MLQRLDIRNLRGIQSADISLAPITVLIGPNNAGKSTVLYALLLLKNIVVNPNQPLDSFFNLGFLNLGGFKQSVFVKDETRPIALAVEVSGDETLGHYGVQMGKHASHLHLDIVKPFELSMQLDVTFPYALSLNASGTFEFRGTTFSVTWNGLNSTISPAEPSELAQQVAAILNFATEQVRGIDTVPLRRGFTKPVYSAVPIPPQVLSDDEVATILANDPDLLGRVDHAFERIFDRNFVVFTPPGTANFYLQSRNRETGLVVELVNEGFGTNQLAFTLAKVFKEGSSSLVCIEEPEIHLHPGAIQRMAGVFARVARESLVTKRRQFLITSHSEHLISSLLALVAKGELSPEDVGLYYIDRKGYETVVERAVVTPKGQIKGGLRGFYEVELAAIRDMLKLDEST